MKVRLLLESKYEDEPKLSAITKSHDFSSIT